MQVKRVAFFTYCPFRSALELYRFVSPLKAAGIELIQGVAAGEPDLDVIAGADLVCFQRDFSRRFKPTRACLPKRAHEGFRSSWTWTTICWLYPPSIQTGWLGILPTACPL